MCFHIVKYSAHLSCFELEYSNIRIFIYAIRDLMWIKLGLVFTSVCGVVNDFLVGVCLKRHCGLFVMCQVFWMSSLYDVSELKSNLRFGEVVLL